MEDRCIFARERTTVWGATLGHYPLNGSLKFLLIRCHWAFLDYLVAPLLRIGWSFTQSSKGPYVWGTLQFLNFRLNSRSSSYRSLRFSF